VGASVSCISQDSDSWPEWTALFWRIYQSKAVLAFICKCLISHAKNSLRVYKQKNSGYSKIRRKIRQQKIPKTDNKFLHIELLSREAWTSKDTKFFTPSFPEEIFETFWFLIIFRYFRSRLSIKTAAQTILSIHAAVFYKSGLFSSKNYSITANAVSSG
jgi:hypothetical protein